MDIFRRGLPVLAYLDDIIIMSSTFEQHLADLEVVFKRLMDFKLRANREKCQFSCSRVKYLGLWSTSPERVCTVAIDVPSRSPKEIRDEQMKDEELVKIISCLEDPYKNVNYVNWVERGYLMNQGVLFRYAPDSESEEAQLVVPIHE
ncbi:uncharacterized protein TNCV_940081 [Trichonephila clavipes]|nr:uncharacterized protein TNCV_940081 [Trichonephila clavipes]